MKTIQSGSNPYTDDKMVGTLTFLESGIVDIFISDDEDIDEVVVGTFHMTSDFIFYALSRPDWLQEFASDYIIPNFDENATEAGPALTLLEGGKEE